MKKIFLKLFVFLLFLFSCEALPVNYSSSQSWQTSSINSKKQDKFWTTLTILSVHVDRSGGWDSVEKEAAALAPLYFWDRKCRVVDAEKTPSYAAQIQIRERDFNHGWKTKKSLAVEVRIWEYEDAPRNGESVLEHKLPAAVGRIITIGDKSFSSSKTTGLLLSKAIKKAVRKLAVYERKKNALRKH
jgi:hypothetical protein